MLVGQVEIMVATRVVLVQVLLCYCLRSRYTLVEVVFARSELLTVSR